MVRTLTRSTLIATFVFFVSGCGGGGAGNASAGGGTLPVPGPTPTTTSSTTFALQAQAASVPLPSIDSYTGMMLVPPGTGTVTVTSMMNPPPGIPVPSGITPMMYVSFVANGGAVTMNQTPGFDMDMMSSSMMGSQSYYMAEYMNGKWSTVEGPAMMSGTTMMMNAATMPISLQAGQQACFAYYTGSALPTPMPSMMP